MKKDNTTTNISNEAEGSISWRVVMPCLFFVVARNDEDSWEQITQGLDTYEKAKNYRDSDFCKKRWANAFIVCTINEE